MSGEEDLSVDAAYALETPEDNKRLYASWATTYDAQFAQAKSYIYPQHVARTFLRRGGIGPVLDAGAGTGLVAEAIQATRDVVLDALDLSAEMLAIARDKQLYRNLIQADLTQPLDLEPGVYGAVVSCGTFTHGHVGPEAFDALIRVAAPGALFVLSIKTELYETHGFKTKLDSFSAEIDAFELEEVRVYGPGADPAHAKDTGLIASFLRL